MYLGIRRTKRYTALYRLSVWRFAICALFFLAASLLTAPLRFLGLFERYPFYYPAFLEWLGERPSWWTNVDLFGPDEKLVLRDENARPMSRAEYDRLFRWGSCGRGQGARRADDWCDWDQFVSYQLDGPRRFGVRALPAMPVQTQARKSSQGDAEGDAPMPWFDHLYSSRSEGIPPARRENMRAAMRVSAVEPERATMESAAAVAAGVALGAMAYSGMKSETASAVQSLEHEGPAEIPVPNLWSDPAFAYMQGNMWNSWPNQPDTIVDPAYAYLPENIYHNDPAFDPTSSQHLSYLDENDPFQSDAWSANQVDIASSSSWDHDASSTDPFGSSWDSGASATDPFAASWDTGGSSWNSTSMNDFDSNW